MDLDFSPADVERIAGVSNNVMRNWRQRGFLDLFGKQTENGRWRYSARDIGAIYIMKEITAGGVPLELAAGFAVAVAEEVFTFQLSALTEVDAPDDWQRFTLIYTDRDGVHKFVKFNEMPKMPLTAVGYLLDALIIGGRTPPALQQLIKATVQK